MLIIDFKLLILGFLGLRWSGPFLSLKNSFFLFYSFILLSPQWPPCCFSTTPGLFQFHGVVTCLLPEMLWPQVSFGSLSTSVFISLPKCYLWVFLSFLNFKTIFHFFLILPFEIISYIKSYSIFKGCFSITRQAQSRTFLCVCVLIHISQWIVAALNIFFTD